MTPRDYYLTAIIASGRVMSDEERMSKANTYAKAACAAWGHWPEDSHCIRCGNREEKTELCLTPFARTHPYGDGTTIDIKSTRLCSLPKGHEGEHNFSLYAFQEKVS